MDAMKVVYKINHNIDLENHLEALKVALTLPTSCVDDLKTFRLYIVERSSSLQHTKAEKVGLLNRYKEKMRCKQIKIDAEQFLYKCLDTWILSPFKEEKLLIKALKSMYHFVVKDLVKNHVNEFDQETNQSIERLIEAVHNQNNEELIRLEAKILLSGSLSVSAGINHVFTTHIRKSIMQANNEILDNEKQIYAVNEMLEKEENALRIFKQNVQRKYHLSDDEIDELIKTKMLTYESA